MRVDAIDEQMHDPMNNGLGLARTGTSDYQQRAAIFCLSRFDAILGGLALFGV